MAMAHQPTEESRKFVIEATAARISQAIMARHLGIAEKTLRAHYRKELDAGAMVIPNLATNVVREYLELKPGDNADPMFAVGLKERQAQVALKAMNSHGWAQQVEMSGSMELPRVISTVAEEDENDI